MLGLAFLLLARAVCAAEEPPVPALRGAAGGAGRVEAAEAAAPAAADSVSTAGAAEAGDASLEGEPPVDEAADSSADDAEAEGPTTAGGFSVASEEETVVGEAAPEELGDSDGGDAVVPFLSGFIDSSTEKGLVTAELNGTEGVLQPMTLVSAGSGWYQGGDKIWGGGRGVESISRSNVRYYDGSMYAARARCGGPSCALIVNPPGRRSVNYFHVHFVHYAAYGANLKRRLESLVCGKPGWRRGRLPCAGKAAFFPGFPGVFSRAMSGGGVQSASVIAWPASCGGRGTIIELAYGCSIEHQIRGDYKPGYR